ncbi:MAG TPA: DUF3667 domain-containing protein [Parafilimonas sp.]|nr:DUF3667 domain-containing protein [Parafilimonas sp.]
MSHGRLRTEKNCLNCNAQVYGRFCSVCGQENIEPKETFWQLLSHFVYDLFHYDGKAVSTIKTLLFHPGLLTYEYVRGRRASYLHPIRLYIFISAMFFLLVFGFSHSDNVVSAENFKAEILHDKDSLQKALTTTSDTLKRNELTKQIKQEDELLHIYDVTGMQMDSSSVKSQDTISLAKGVILTDNTPGTIAEYDSIQKALPEKSRDGWLMQKIEHKVISINQKYKGRRVEFYQAIKEKFVHSLPQMMFVSVPVAALIFSLLYIRRKKFTYVQHGVLIVHIYSAVFIFNLLVYALGLLNDYLHWQFLSVLSSITVIFIFFYVYKSMRNFYEQRRFKTILKYFIFLLCYSVVLALLLIIFSLTSLIQV